MEFNPKVVYIDEMDRAEKFIKIIHDKPMIGLDTETVGDRLRNRRVRLLQIATSPYEVAIYDLFKLPEACRGLFHDHLSAYLGHDTPFSAVLVGHNLKFDICALWNEKIDITGTTHSWLFDTYLAEQLLENEIGGFTKERGYFKLDSVIERNLGFEISKELQTSDWSGELSSEQLLYAGRDAGVLLLLAKRMGERLAEADLKIAAALDFRCLPAIASMEYNGIKLDLNKWSKLTPVFERQLAESEKAVLHALPDVWQHTDFFGGQSYNISVGSSAQLLEKLQSMDIPDPFDSNSLLTSTGKQTLGMLNLDDYPIIEKILAWRKASKSLTGFIKPMPDRIDPETGRLHTNLLQHGTVSGRVTSTSPNLNQIPRDAQFRECFIAEDGYKIIDADYSGLELRLIAFMYGERIMLEEYAKDPDADLHSLTAKLFLKTDDPAIIKAKRPMGKASNFLLCYAGGANTLRHRAKTDYGVSMTTEEAYKYHYMYHQTYVDIDRKHQEIIGVFNRARSAKNYKLITPPRTRSGRRLLPLDPRTPNQIVNFPIQGTASDLGKNALGDLYYDLKEHGIGPMYKQDCKILLYIYDEIIVEAKEKYADYYAERLQSHMEAAGKRFCTTAEKSVPIIAEPHIGDNWAEAK